MTREEAIKWMEETIQDAEGLLDKCSPVLKEEVLEQNEVFKIAISALRSVSREQVEMAWRSEWKPFAESAYGKQYKCPNCHTRTSSCSNFCPHCGAPMSDEAVQMVMERWKEALE